MPKKNKFVCHNAKCAKPLTNGTVCFDFGTSVAGDIDPPVNDLKAFACIFVHGADENAFGSVDLYDKSQYKYNMQAESYFCSKQCLIDWFSRKIKNLPEPS